MNDEHQEPEEEIQYKGHTIPKFLKVLYVTFIIWAIFYFSSFVLPAFKTGFSK